MKLKECIGEIVSNVSNTLMEEWAASNESRYVNKAELLKTKVTKSAQEVVEKAQPKKKTKISF